MDRADDSTTISGTVPDKYQNGTTNPVSIPITIASTNTSNTLTLTAYYDLNIQQYPFSAYSLPDIKAAPGDKVDVKLGSYINNATGITISTSSLSQRKRALGDWLSYDSSSQSLTGTVPKDAKEDFTLTLTANSGSYTGTSDLRVNVTPGSSNSSAAPSASSTSGSGNSSGGGLSKGGKIGLGVGLGILALILLLLLLFCCRRRRQRQQTDNDGDSFVAGPRSPMGANDPFRKSTQNPHRSIFGTMGLPWGKPDAYNSSPQPSMDTNATMVEKPQRVDGLNGIFAMEKPAKGQSTPRLNNASAASFTGQGDVIAVSTHERTPQAGDMSSFTDSFSSGSRASWESEHSFKWSSGENESRQQHENSDARLSLAPSIARPRENFTPRYPRSNSPSRLQQLASGRTLDSPDFSEFGSPQSQSRRSVTSPGFTASGSLGTGSNGSHSGSGSAPSGATFPSGPTGLDRWSRGDSSGTGMVLAEYDEDEHTDHEEPAVVKMAERQSFETRRPSTKRSIGPRLKPSRERMTSDAVGRSQPRHSRQLEQDEGMFDDAEDDHRRSHITDASRLTTYAPDPNEDATHGLGYPTSAIYFAEGKRDSTIQAIDAEAHNHPLSPPLPSVGSFVRPRPVSTASAEQAGARTSRTSTELPSPKIPDGRVNAIANETFSIHPQIHPPPTVSLSAATWSSAPPSSYRAELVGGGQLPSWLHFDSRNLELWGVPAMEHSGDVLVLRIVEKMPRDKRGSNPMAFGYQPAPEREVGRMTIE